MVIDLTIYIIKNVYLPQNKFLATPLCRTCWVNPSNTLCTRCSASGDVAGESLALYAGIPVTGLVLLVVLISVVVLLRRQILPTAGGLLIYANLC